MLENKTLLQNRYLIEKQIGAGGMGAVYLAVDERFGSNVAIKETFYSDLELGKAFGREAHLLNSLHHPVLPHVSDYFTENNGHFLVMQFIEGDDLFEILQRDGVFPFQDVIRWTDSLLDALDYLHSQLPPIIHRDIKPQNLKITARGDIILLDFGLAKLTSDDNSGMKSVFGYSRKYSPLEQIQGTGTDARSDLFALAATVYHLLTGKPPIDALTRASAIVNGEADPLCPASELNSEIPVDLGNVLTAGLALNASKRFISAKAMRLALNHSVNSGLTEEIKDLLEHKIFIPSVENTTLSSSEIESFPALDSFVAETVNISAIPINADKSDVNEISPFKTKTVRLNLENQPEVIPIPVEENKENSENIETDTKVIPVSAVKTNHSQIRRSRIGAGILAAIICVGLAAWYYISAASLQAETKPNPVIQANSESASEIDAVPDTLPEPPPEAEKSSVLEVKKETKNKPVKNETIAVRSEPVEDIPNIVEALEKPKPTQNKPENKRPNTQKTQTVVETPRRENSPPPNVQTEVPDIESVFTGRSSQEREKRQQRRENRRAREEMTPEELEEFRRIRREERRRQNQQSIPPF